ncbi:MAG: hypothetical protein QM570_13605 [Planctomycetota bacterium]|jgi:hypothetical protein|nr:hypothetical protein [Planctomycetota bacterium]
MKYQTRTSYTLPFLCVLLFMIAVFAAAPAWADIPIAPGGTVDGTLTYDDGITATGKWATEGTKLDFSVTRPADGGPLTYSYTFWAPSTQPGVPALSHIDIQVSGDTDGGLPAFSIDNAMDFINSAGYELGKEVYHIDSTSGQISDTWTDEAIKGIRFDEMFDDSESWTVEFQSYRLPMWGGFFAKGGQSTAYNTFTGTVAVPNATYVPVPGAALLGFLGFGWAGLKLRKRM